MGKQNINRVKAFLSGLIFFHASAWRDHALCERYGQSDEIGVPVFQSLTDRARLKIMHKIKSPQKLVELLNQARVRDGLTNFMYLNAQGQQYVDARLTKNEDYLALFRPLTKDGHTALNGACLSTQQAFVQRVPTSKMMSFFKGTLSHSSYNEFVYLVPELQDSVLQKISNPQDLKSFLLMPANREGRSVFQFLSTEQKLGMVLRMPHVNDVYDLYKNRFNEVDLEEIVYSPKDVRQSILKRFPNLTDAVVQAYRKVDFQPRTTPSLQPAHQYQ